MTLWEYLTWVEDLAISSNHEILVKHRGRSLWGKSMSGCRIGDVSHFNVWLDGGDQIMVSHKDLVKYRDREGNEHLFPRHKEDGQTKLF